MHSLHTLYLLTVTIPVNNTVGAAAFAVAPTVLSYHKQMSFVNKHFVISHSFCILHETVSCTLYKFPCCKADHFVLLYRHKEVIPMYR